MTMPKKYVISESQFKALIERKKEEKVIFNKIIEEISTIKTKLNEAKYFKNKPIQERIHEVIVLTLKKHTENGPMSKSLVESLLTSKLVTIEHLNSAGIKTSGVL